MNPTVCFKTIGCRLNQAETARIAAQFEAAGYGLAEPEQACDVALIHTCAITHVAQRDCVRWARRLRRAGARVVVLAGCAVELDAEDLQRATGADLLVGQKQKFDIPALLHDRFGIGLPVAANENAGPAAPFTPLLAMTRALVKVQDGCDFRCSYCVVPDTRGTAQSRPLADVLEDVRRLAGDGYREITLTGANLGCYASPPHSLIHLLEAVETVPGIMRFRIGSIESTTVEREVIDYMAASRKLCRFLHLPLQSGDDGVLARMRRRYTAAQYRATVEYAVARMPDLGLGTDVITGFPGETEGAFASTVALIRDLPFSNLHVFPYSPRRGTPAATMPGQVREDVKKARTAELIALGREKRQAFAQSFVGNLVSMIAEHTSEAEITIGWSGQYLPVRLEGTALPPNTAVTCLPVRCDGDVLLARRILSVA
jgi:threonylcarbamoyladenosine tRNA methylthiotransferase MtaB